MWSVACDLKFWIYIQIWCVLVVCVSCIICMFVVAQLTLFSRKIFMACTSSRIAVSGNSLDWQSLYSRPVTNTVIFRYQLMLSQMSIWKFTNIFVSRLHAVIQSLTIPSVSQLVRFPSSMLRILQQARTGWYQDKREDQVDQERTGGLQSTKTYKRWGSHGRKQRWGDSSRQTRE